MSSAPLPVRVLPPGGSGPYLTARTLDLAIRAMVGDPSFEGPYLAFDPYGRIVSVAISVARRFGFEDDRLLGRRLVQQIAAPERGRFAKLLVQARLAGTFGSTLFPFRTRAGDPIPGTLVSRALLTIERRPVFVTEIRWSHPA